MGDLADRALKKYDDQRTDRQTKDDLARDNRQARELYGSARWNELKEAVSKECKDLNAKAGSRSIRLTIESSVTSELAVRADIDGRMRRLGACYEESTGKLSWSCGRISSIWIIEATKDGEAQFAGTRGPRSAEWIANEMLSSLMDLG
jgi:hypothetical protein